MRSRLLAAAGITVVTTVLATTMSGCGSGSSGSSGKTIKVVYQQQLNNNNKVQANYLAPMVKAFEKANPGTTVKLVPVTASENDYYTKIQLMMRSPSTAPDLVYEDTATINTDVAAGYLKPLDSYLSSWQDWSKYADASKTAMKYAPDGKTYGVPDNTDTRGIWYNKKLFAQAGIPVPWQPKTWDDLLSAAQTIKAKVPGVTPLNLYTGTAGGEQSSMQGFEMLLYGTQAGNDALYDSKQQKWVVGSKGFKDALTFLHTLYSTGLAPSAQKALDPNVSATIGTELIPQGKLAMDIDGSWMPNNWIRTGAKPWPDWQTTMGMAAMPSQSGNGTGKVSMSGGWAWSIPAKSKNPDLAWKFIQSLETEAASAQWNTVNATIPVRSDVAADAGYLKSLPTNQFFSALVANTFYRPGLPAYTQVSTAIQKAMESVTTGQASVDKAAATFDSDVKTAVGADKTVQGAQVTASATSAAPHLGAGKGAGGNRRRPSGPAGALGALLRGMPLVPSVVLLTVFLAGPIAYCVYYAFTDMQLTGAAGTHFVGFDNFTRAFKDSDFTNAVELTLVFVVGSAVIGQNTLGLALAVLMEKASKPVRSFTSTVVIAAWVLPEVVAGYLMYAFFFQQGSLNAILDALHLPQQNWLYTMPILAVCIANVWRGTAFSMLVYSAALNDVPQELTEAAEVDGAGPWQRLWRVTLPVIRRSVMTNLMLITLQTLSVFGLIYTMTRGGPGNKAETLPVFMYQQAFQNSLIGYGTAIALVLLVVGALFSAVYIRMLKVEED